MPLNRPVLVLNKSYIPVNVTGPRRAMALVLSGGASTVESSGQFIRAGHTLLPVPSVIALANYNKVPKQNRTVNRKTILLRDRYTCQYCGELRVKEALTLDHVIPQSRRGPSTWENLVACCRKCNHRKADRTPEEAGMKLLHRPARIGIHAKLKLLAAGQDESWNQYLFC